MTFHRILAAIEAGTAYVDTFDDLARAALAEGEEEAALARIVPAAERSKVALLWQWAGLLQRALDEHGDAIQSFTIAADQAPNDPGIAHGRARVTLEAGLDSVELFLRAQALAPNDGGVALGLAAARNAIGEGEFAADELRAKVLAAPAWTAGHEQLSQLLSTLGQKERVTDSIELAIARFPTEFGLWSSLFNIYVQREDYLALQHAIERAAAAGAPAPSLDPYRAIAAAELAEELFPEALFKASPHLGSEVGLWQIRHLLRHGSVEHALPIIELELASPRAFATWPYASIAWRLVDDKRAEWLEGDPRIVQVYDLTDALPGFGELVATLRPLHVAKGEYVDQSVRGGTQTDGPLLSRIDPVIRKTRAAIIGAVDNYRAGLPAGDEHHPLLTQRRDRRIRFSGSWSVKLGGGGHHANHVHTQGWISSALYISLPERSAGEGADAGWLSIGEPQDALGVTLPPSRKIEPRVGHLALFPSWMWHGTIPFSQGERLTIAFDVRPPI